MISNKQYKDHLRSIIVLFEGLYKPGHEDKMRQEIIYKLTEQANAIPDDPNPDDWVRPPHLRYESHGSGNAIVASDDEAKRYREYIDSLRVGQMALLFGTWLVDDRLARHKYNREAGDGHDEFS